MLLQRKLINEGLVPLTPKLVERYNECLTRAGLQPTERTALWVDGVGWSPQVARERQDRFYLSNGVINPLAIVVTPDQYKKPVYFPLFSWQRPLMRLFFDKYHREIMDITATHAITLDLEDGISALESPLQLLLLSSIMAMPDTGNLSEAAAKQAGLIAHYFEGLNCLEEKVRADIVNHRRQFGDLRKRQVTLSPVAFDHFRDFHTVAYDGVFVLRNVSGEDMLILENKNRFAQLGGHSADSRVYWLGDNEFSPYGELMRAGWIEVPVEEFKQKPDLLEEKKELLLSWSLCDCSPDLEWGSLTPSKRKSVMQSSEHRSSVPEIYFELERLAASLKGGVAVPKISEELWYFLAAPSKTRPPETRDLLWTLLTRKDPRNILEGYTYDKNFFLSLYDGWGKQKQSWAADYIAARYQPRMSQP